jgi:hypothetical protein
MVPQYTQGFDRIESSSTPVVDGMTTLSVRDTCDFLLLLLLLLPLPFILILRCAPDSSSAFLFLLDFLPLLLSGLAVTFFFLALSPFLEKVNEVLVGKG